MCQHGDIVEIEIVQRIKVDRCIAEEIKWLNAQGVRTEASCCGHGKSYPEALIRPSSIERARELGYNPVEYPNSEYFEIKLKSGELCKCSVARPQD